MRSDLFETATTNKGTHIGAHARTRRASTPYSEPPDYSRPDMVSHRLMSVRGRVA
jgi:hypothetical protein